MKLQIPWQGGTTAELFESLQPLMTPSEQECYQHQAEDDKLQYLIRLWTHKEAFSKAIGKGLRMELADFDIQLAAYPGDLTQVNQAGHTMPFRFTEWSLDDEHVLVTAVETTNHQDDWLLVQIKVQDLDEL